jgi:AAA ATPase domain
MNTFKNPFRPGAGQLPPYLAGRQIQIDEFENKILTQDPTIKNLIISGLRGVGKTVLLDTLKPIALKEGWIVAGTDLSESASSNEINFSIRFLTDLASAVSNVLVSTNEVKAIGFKSKSVSVEHYLNYEVLEYIYKTTNGLEADKLKAVLKFTWDVCQKHAKGIILAYDEAQNLKDSKEEKQYPLSLLLEITQHAQRIGLPMLLILTGLPTLMSNLIAARTYAERMFHQVLLSRLSDDDSREAIERPIQDQNCPVSLAPEAIDRIVKHSGGYPYFIQYICKETYDGLIQQQAMGVPIASIRIRIEEIIRKLDIDFYQARWNRATDKQRNLLNVIAQLENAESEFSMKDIEAAMKSSGSKVTASAINIMLKSLAESSLIYKTRYGFYSFAVPMFSHFVKREMVE